MGRILEPRRISPPAPAHPALCETVKADLRHTRRTVTVRLEVTETSLC
jgi:hypothetical protein